MNEEATKIDRFLCFIEQRIIERIEGTDIGESCTATLLLIFAAIDSLSKITCSDREFEEYKKPNGKRGNRHRFTGFLGNMMPQEYENHKQEIWNLRNDIVHTGIGTKVILSKNDLDTRHLEEANGHLWINTRQFFNDFIEAFHRIKKDIRNKGSFYQNARNRLNDFNIISIDDEDPATPSPGPDDSVF